MLVYIIVSFNKEIYIKLGLLDGISNVLGILIIILSEVVIIVVDIVIKSGDI